MSKALALFDSASIVVSPTLTDAIHEWTEFCRSKACRDGIAVDAMGQDIVTDIASAAAKANAWLAEYQRMADEWRRPDYERFKAKKAASDGAVLQLSEAIAELLSEVRDFEREKVRIERAINEQREREAREKAEAELKRQAEAELERRRQEDEERRRLEDLARAAHNQSDAQAKAALEAKASEERQRQRLAEIERDRARAAEEKRLATVSTVEKYEAARTEGVTTKIVYEFDVESKEALAMWCWKTGRAWVNDVTFFRRDILQYLNQDGADRNIPGLRVYQSIGATIKKAKQARAIVVQSSSKTEL